MRNLLNPRWLFVFNTLPLIVLTLIFTGEFSIIKHLIGPKEIQTWWIFGGTLLALATLTALYALLEIRLGRKLSLPYGLTALVAYIAFCYCYIYNAENILPPSVPDWMLSGEIFLYVCTFLMPTLAHAFFVVVVFFTPENKTHSVLKNFAIAVAFPTLAYMISAGLSSLHFLGTALSQDFKYLLHLVVVFAIVGTVLFFFFFVRGLFILFSDKNILAGKYGIPLKVLVAIVLPFLGLAFNNGLIVDINIFSGNRILGDFSSIWFYILAGVNGLFVVLNPKDSVKNSTILFLGRSLTFSFTLYFFVVFLPFLPFAIPAILAMGLGFLILTPAALFVLHCLVLHRDFTLLKTRFSPKILIFSSLLASLVLPATVLFNFSQDRKTLHSALDFLYAPDLTKTETDFDRESLAQTLSLVKANVRRQDGPFNGSKTPFLSAIYANMVLDNLTLSKEKITRIEKVFLGGEKKVKPTLNDYELELVDLPQPAPITPVTEVNISQVAVNSRYDSTSKAYLSEINLELTNTGQANEEFFTTFTLPDGCWISDYHLFVNGKKEMGQLAEKKTALWVYNNIRNTNRDPGILHYLSGNRIQFRVFPFAKKETRKTGFELLHRGPVVLTLNGTKININAPNPESYRSPDVSYVSVEEKATLKKAVRKPYFHFLVDVSEGRKDRSVGVIFQIEELIRQNQKLAEGSKISFVTTEVKTLPLTANWKKQFDDETYEGGFNLDRAIKKAYLSARKDSLRPVVVAMYDSLQNAVLDDNYYIFKDAFPELPYFFNINTNAQILPHSLLLNSALPSQNNLSITTSLPVLAYPMAKGIAYLPDDGQPSIVGEGNISVPSSPKSWATALATTAAIQEQAWQPQLAEKQWVSQVKQSFQNHVLSPFTAFLVVETEVQRAVLAKKQAEVLAGKASLDLSDEDTPRMSEPGLWLCLLFLLGFLIARKHSTKI